jgi:hypothetical protein
MNQRKDKSLLLVPHMPGQIEKNFNSAYVLKWVSYLLPK